MTIPANASTVPIVSVPVLPLVPHRAGTNMTRVIVAQMCLKRPIFSDANEFSAFVAQEYFQGNFPKNFKTILSLLKEKSIQHNFPVDLFSCLNNYISLVKFSNNFIVKVKLILYTYMKLIY